jgi:hypothetical protein
LIPELLTQIAIARESLDVFRECRSFAWTRHESAAAVHQLWQAAPRAHEDRPSRRHRLEGRQWGILVTQGRHDEEAASGNRSPRVSSVHAAREFRAVQTKPRG